MGLLRVLLALAVVIDHTPPIQGMLPTSGRVAVECFYVISGFYMAMVLERKYLRLPQRPWATFMGARIARLWPIYLIVAFTTAVSLFLANPVRVDSQGADIPGLFSLPAATWIPLLLANLLIVGQDWVMFFAVNSDGYLYFTTNFLAENLPAFRYLLVPQAWTVGVELLFYLCAPWLARRGSGLLVAIGVVSIALRVAAASFLGLQQDPWGYRFFPFEIVFFLAGMLAYRYRDRLLMPGPQYLPIVIAIAAVVAFPSLQTTGLTDVFTHVAFPVIIALMIPSVFAATRRNAADRWVGELSYPLYMVHVLVITALLSAFGDISGVICVAASLIAAVVLTLVFDRPIERLRQRVIEKRLLAGGIPEAGRSAGVGPGLAADP